MGNCPVRSHRSGHDNFADVRMLVQVRRIMTKSSTVSSIARVLLLASLPAFVVTQAQARDVVPVTLDFGEYSRNNETIMDLIGDELRKSRLLVQNVDANQALRIRARFIGRSRRNLRVVYLWNGRTLSKASYQCGATRLKKCAFEVVKGTERISRASRL